MTDLRTDVGQFAQAGAPAMTLIAMHDLWISADMTENNLGNIKPGDEVAIVLDVMPGEVLKGRVRSVGTGISPGKQAHPARCRRSRTAATGCGRRSASRWPSSSTRPSASDCAACESAARPTCWSTRATTADELARRGLHPPDELLFVSLLIGGPMHRADKAVLRLAIGLGLAVLIAYGLALPLPFVGLRDGRAVAVQAGAADPAREGRGRRARRHRGAGGAAC